MRKQKLQTRNKRQIEMHHSHAFLFYWLVFIILLSSQFIVNGQQVSAPTDNQIKYMADFFVHGAFSAYDKFEYYKINPPTQDADKVNLEKINREDPSGVFKNSYFVRFAENIQVRVCKKQNCKYASDLTTEDRPNVLVMFLGTTNTISDIKLIDPTNLQILDSSPSLPLNQNQIFTHQIPISDAMNIIDKSKSQTESKAKMIKTDEWYIPVLPSLSSTPYIPGEEYFIPLKTTQKENILRDNEVLFSRRETNNKYNYYLITEIGQSPVPYLGLLESDPIGSVTNEKRAIRYMEAREIQKKYIEADPSFQRFSKLTNLIEIKKFATSEDYTNFDEAIMFSNQKLIIRNSAKKQDQNSYKILYLNVPPFEWQKISNPDFNTIKNKESIKPFPTNFELIGESIIITPPAKSAGSDQYETIVSLIHDADGDNIITLPDPTDISDTTKRDNIIVYGPNNDPQTKTLSFNTKPRPKDCLEPPQVEIIWPVADSEIDRRLNTAIKIDENGNIVTKQGIEVVAWDDCDQIQYIALYDEKAYTIERQNYAKEQSEKAKVTQSPTPPVPMPAIRGAIQVCDNCQNGQFYKDLGINTNILYNYNPGDYLTLIVRIVDKKGKESEDRVRLIMSKEIKGTSTQPSIVAAPGATQSASAQPSGPQPASPPSTVVGSKRYTSFSAEDLLKLEYNKIHYYEDERIFQFGKVVIINGKQYIFTNTYDKFTNSPEIITFSVTEGKINRLTQDPKEIETENAKFLAESNDIIAKSKK